MTGLQQMEYNIARCRVVLSVAALLVVYIDPETPLLERYIPFVSGPFVVDPRLFIVMVAHLTYSLVVYFGLGRVVPLRLAHLTAWADMLFGGAIAVMTEGVTGPSYPYFAFAVASTGLRGGMQQAMLITTASLAMYTCLILVSVHGDADVYIMRPVYLAITGYLLGYLGQQRLELQEQMRRLEVAEQRHRIARDLHDGYAQALSGINLRLETSRRLLRSDQPARALTDLTDLQESVKREFDDLRRYARSLAGVEATPSPDTDHRGTRLSLQADVAGSVELIDHVLSIAREGVSNVRRHACAATACIEMRADGGAIRIDIKDDGVGFDTEVMPWSIASRVREIGGQIDMVSDQRPGAHLLITVPAA